MKRRLRWRFALLLLLLALTVLLATAALHLKPVLLDLATAQAENSVNQIVAAAVEETIYHDGLDYDRLITFEKDAQGRISALKSNMAEFNRLQSAISKEVLRRLGEVSTRDLRIPLGTLSGSPLLSGRGPAILVRMQSVGSSFAHFENVFSDAGINQTRHQILLTVEVNLRILLPGFSAATRVRNEFSVAETVLVGAVPETYTYFHSDELITDAENYILNR